MSSRSRCEWVLRFFVTCVHVCVRIRSIACVSCSNDRHSVSVVMGRTCAQKVASSLIESIELSVLIIVDVRSNMRHRAMSIVSELS